jgi:hypothetical protein
MLPQPSAAISASPSLRPCSVSFADETSALPVYEDTQFLMARAGDETGILGIYEDTQFITGRLPSGGGISADAGQPCVAGPPVGEDDVGIFVHQDTQLVHQPSEEGSTEAEVRLRIFFLAAHLGSHASPFARRPTLMSRTQYHQPVGKRNC